MILGCTHYPLIRPIFQRVFGRGVTLVFSAEETAREVAETLARKGIENDCRPRGHVPVPDHRRHRGLPRHRRALPPAADRRGRARRARRPREGGRMSRADGRRPDQLRPLEIVPDYLEQPHGAVLFTQGKTRVLCTASVDESVPRWMSGRGVGLDHRRVLAASGVDRPAHAARGVRRAAEGADGRDPAADRAGGPRGHRLRGARRADALARLRRPPGRRRHALRGDLRRVRRRPPRARPLRALEGDARLGRRRLARDRPAASCCSTSTTRRTRPRTST